MNEVFLDLVNKLDPIRKASPPPPPPLPELYFTTKDKKIKDSLLDHANVIHKKLIDSLNQIIIKLKSKSQQIEKKKLIAVSDTIYKITHKNIEFAKRKTNIDFSDLSQSDSIQYKIKIENFSHSNKYKFQYRSKYPARSKIWKWRRETDSKLKAIVSFSRIIFDKEKKHGLLRAGITYWRLNGYGGIFIIKKTKGKWVILECFETWIS
jgi:hypothetical protein